MCSVCSQAVRRHPEDKYVEAVIGCLDKCVCTCLCVCVEEGCSG